MLQDLERLGKDFQGRFEAIKLWPEIKFSATDKHELAKLPGFMNANESSIQIKVSESTHCILPSQYFLYAVLIKEFALSLKKYVDIVEQLRAGIGPNETWGAINSADISVPFVSSLDDYSKSIFYKPFKYKECVLGSKDILNGTPENRKLRGDFFGSVILKVVNVPDVSSASVGHLIENLSSNEELYSYFEKRYLPYLPYILNTKAIRQFVRSVLSFLDQYDGFSKIKSTITQNPGSKNLSIEYQGDKITSIFFASPTVVSEAGLIHGGHLRYFTEPIIMLDGNYIYLSNQWSDMPDDPGSKDINIFKKIIEACYPELSIDKENGEYFLRSSKPVAASLTQNTGASNVILYGAPGTGKSYRIDSLTDSNTAIRTVFHADTQYSDFVGCLKPTVTGSSPTYSFRPGPFSIALAKAIKEPANHYWLVIEEINRASAAAVFGEIFQLLDRDEHGMSVYPITPSDQDMINYLESETSKTLENGQIRIPSNLSIIATMNSSDQAVMPLDTAFKRRWKFDYVPLSFAKCAMGSLQIPIPAKGITQVSWEVFAKSVNSILSENEIPEDRHLGPFFLNDHELKDSKSQTSALTGKLFMYLWDDVLRHGNRPLLFNTEIKTYGQLSLKHGNDEYVFAAEFYALLEQGLASSEAPEEAGSIVIEAEAET